MCFTTKPAQRINFYKFIFFSDIFLICADCIPFFFRLKDVFPAYISFNIFSDSFLIIFKLQSTCFFNCMVSILPKCHIQIPMVILCHPMFPYCPCCIFYSLRQATYEISFLCTLFTFCLSYCVPCQDNCLQPCPLFLLFSPLLFPLSFYKQIFFKSSFSEKYGLTSYIRFLQFAFSAST